MADQPLSLSQLAARNAERNERPELQIAKGTWRSPLQKLGEAGSDIDSYEQIVAKLVAAGEAMYGAWPSGGRYDKATDAWRTLLKGLEP